MVFEKLYYNFYREIYQFAFQLSSSRPESEDLVQQTFMRLHKEFTKGVNLDNPRAWLYKVVLNLWRNKYNKSKMQQLNNTQFNWNEHNNQTPEINFIKQEKRDLVFDCLAQLPEKDRDILLLYHDGLSYAEMAKILDMKYTSVGTTLSRSIKKLKLALKTKHHELFE